MAAPTTTFILFLILTFIPFATPTQTPTLISTILTNLNFPDLSTASLTANLSFPLTIFAPSQSSLQTSLHTSLPHLLQQHSLPGLYPFHFLRSLTFGTKIPTLSSPLFPTCLSITSTTPTSLSQTKKIFVNGNEITKPDLFNNGFLIVHVLHGFLAPLSPLSCNLETMSTVSLIPMQKSFYVPTSSFFVMQMMLKDAMSRLRVSGYSVAALSMRAKYSELADLKTMTMFVVDDESLFRGGKEGEGGSYVGELGFHVVPDRLLNREELLRMGKGEVLRTLERGGRLVVTTEGNGGGGMFLMGRMRINYVAVERFDIVSNHRIVVHGLSRTFRHVEGIEDSDGLVMGGVSPAAASSYVVVDDHREF